MNIYLPVPASSSCLVMSTVSPNMSYRGFLRPTTPATQGPGKKNKTVTVKPCLVLSLMISTNPLCTLYPYRHTTEFINNRALSRQGESYFLNSEMMNKIHARPSTKKSTERHLRALFHSPPFFLSLLRPLQPALSSESAREQSYGCAERCVKRLSALKHNGAILSTTVSSPGSFWERLFVL